MKDFLRQAFNPLKLFISDSRFTGMLLIVCTLISLLLSNSNATSHTYLGIWNSELHYPAGIKMPHTILKWINDFLMAFFFFFAGLEIKRELIEGELSSFKKAVLPFGAALGGMIVPALIYLAFNIETPFAHGWGIPTATDIAFSLGIASLFGKRIPTSLKVFLMALAIIDDLGAIIVITLFYGGNVEWIFLLIGLVIYGLFWLLNYLKFKVEGFRFVLAFLLWYVVFLSGIEASISGVLIAFTIPVNTVPKLEKLIHKFVNFYILPVFALANTAIIIPAGILISLKTPVGMGIIAGLVIGKPIGIFLFSRMLISLKLAKLPTNTTLKQLLGIGSLAGIGFTMSIFTTALAFHEEIYRNIAMISILFSLVLSIIFSWLYFNLISKKVKQPYHKKFDHSIAPGKMVLAR